jgi:hypothetical protein
LKEIQVSLGRKYTDPINNLLYVARSISTVQNIEEGRAEVKVLITNLAIFFLIPSKEVSANIILNSAVVNFSPLKKKEKKRRQKH